MNALILDTESTGLVDPVPVEIAYKPVRFAPITPVAGRAHLESDGNEFLQRYNPGKPIEIEALATHHILDRELTECPAQECWSFPAGVDYVIGHNVDYDCQVARVPAYVKRICTLAVARELYADGRHSQTALLYRLTDHVLARELARGAHSALKDVQICLLLLNSMLLDARMATVDGMASLYAFSEAARLPKIMGFGKHKGMPVDKVPMDYRFWYARQEDPDPWLLKAWKLAPAGGKR